MTTIGFIGAGKMGAPIVARLLQAGHCVVLPRRHAEFVKGRAECGLVATAADVARAASVVFTCLPSPEASLAVHCGPDGLLSGSTPASLLIELSTIDPATAVRLGEASAAAGARFIDAPVSGGPMAAAEGTLTVMIGGPESVVAEADPFLATFATKRIHMGGVGAGSVAKLCNQMLVGVSYLAIAEAMVLGKRAGLDPELLHEVLRASSGRSALLDYASSQFMLPRRFDAAFRLDCLTKDLDCVERAADFTGARVVMAAAAKAAFQEAESMGLGRLDAAAILLSAERAADERHAATSGSTSSPSTPVGTIEQPKRG